MKKGAVIVLVLAAFVAACRAEPRWCPVVGKDSSDRFFYPPIARAARVSGVVLERVIYLPSGTVQSFEFVSGPPILAAGLEHEMKGWSLRTGDKGEEACVSLVIAEFRLDESSGESTSQPIDVSVPGILRLRASAAPICLCDPGGYASRRPLFQRVRRAIRRMFVRHSGVGN